MWEITNEEFTIKLTGHTDEVSSLAWSPDGSLIASGSGDNTIIVWDSTNGEVITRLIRYRTPVRSLSWSPDGSRLVSGTSDHPYHADMWDISTGEIVGIFGSGSYGGPSVDWSSDGRYVATEVDYYIHVIDVANPNPTTTLALPAQLSISTPLSTLTPAIDGTQPSLLATPTLNGLESSPMADLLLTPTFTPIPPQPFEKSFETFIKLPSDGGPFAFGPDGRLLAINSSSNESFDEQKDISPLQAPVSLPTPTVNELESSPPLPTSTPIPPTLDEMFNERKNVTITIWNLVENNPVITLTGYIERGFIDQASSNNMAWSPDGSRLALAGSAQIVVWDVNQSQSLFRLAGHSSLAWSLDGTYLISPAQDNTVIVWDAVSGEPLTTLAGHVGRVTSVDLSPNGLRLATGGADRRILIINSRFMKPPCQWALRNMSLEEWEQYFPGEEYRQTCPNLPVHPSVKAGNEN